MPRNFARNVFSSSSPSHSSAADTAPTATSAALPDALADPSQPMPKIIVFDLDYTLWPFWVDTHVTPPLKPNAAHSAATDRFGDEYAFYADVPAILRRLPRLTGGARLALASRTSSPGLARDLLKMLHLPPPTLLQDDEGGDGGGKPRKALEVFDAGMEIYPGNKIKHFEAIHKRTGVAYQDMLFFDDESRNMETQKLGITMQLIHEGVTWQEVAKGVEKWRQRTGQRKNSP